MSKVTAIKKVISETKQVAEQAKNCRIPSVEIPGTIMLAVQKLVKDKGYTMAQFWKEAASMRLQMEDVKSAKEELDRILGQIAYAERKLREIEEREQLLMEKELKMEEEVLKQKACFDERMAEINSREKDLEEIYQLKMGELEEMMSRQKEEHRQCLNRIEEEVRERNEEYRRSLELEFFEKEKELSRREAHVQVREEIALEKEKFWAAMYDAVVKLTRVCGTLK
ncbi:MAG TPA: hypothetical protein PK728_08620 [Bacillota bacterium]|nr:hypothetical protein [Bacillota bacterium]